MKFTKERPKEDGYCWYVDLTYPIEKIGWIGMGKFFDAQWDELEFDSHVVKKWIRFGDHIPQPDCNEIEIER